MPKVEAWQCPYTNKLFSLSEEKEYKMCVEEEEANIKIFTEAALAKEKYDDWFLSHRMKIHTIEGIRRFCIDEWDTIYSRHCQTHAYDKAKNIEVPLTLLDIQFDKVRYSDRARNTHSCPRGERTQWSGKTTYDDGTFVPRGRPGFECNVRITYNRGNSGFSSRVFERCGIHTGTGGYRNSPHGEYRLEYDCVMFLADWEGLQTRVESLRKEHREDGIISRLKGHMLETFDPMPVVMQ